MVAQATIRFDWPQVASFTPDPGYNGRKPLAAISFSSSTNGNAVGYYNDENTAHIYITQAQHWDGTSWEYVPTYNYPDTYNYLYGVTTISSTDAWAVGTYLDSNGNLRALIEHYSAATDTWVNYPITITSSVESVLTSVTSNSSSDVWAVGYYLPDTLGAVRRTLTMHYNGSTWSVASSPNAVPSSGTAAVPNKLYGVTNVPGNSALLWAVGAYDDGSGHLKTLTMQGNASSSSSVWTIVSSPNVSGVTNCLRSVSALNGDNVWAVGFTGDLCSYEPATGDVPDAPPSGTNVSLIQKWDSSSSTWNVESHPNPSNSINLLYGVSAASSSRVWAVGYYVSVSGGYVTMVLGRDSSDNTWRQHCSANPADGNWDRLLAIDALSGSEAWAAGWYELQDMVDKPTLIERYDPPDEFCSP